MPTSTLHLNNPVPSNGAVVSSFGGSHTVTATLFGVGAISCVVQAWGSEQGTDARRVGNPVTISGTTTVSQTLTFDVDCKQFWLELVRITDACKFSATVFNDGTLVSSGPIVAPNIYTPNAGPKRIIIEGDSISCDASSFSGGWANLFSILSRGEYIIAYNDAIGGTTLPQMAARFGSIPSYVKADEVHLQGGTNSPGITTANKDALESLRVQILARGAVPVIHSIPPLYNDPSAMDWNVYLQQWCNKYGFRFIDKWADIIDPALGRISDTYLYANDAAYVHPNAAGHLVAAKKCLDLLRAGSGTGTTPYSLIVDKSTNKGIGLSSNALFSANTGGLATGWDAQLSGSGVTSTPTIVDLTSPWVGKGQRWQDTMTANGANYYQHTKTIAVPAGHRVRIVYGYFKLTGFTEDAPNKFTMQVRMSTNLGPVSEQLTRIPAIAVEGSLVREYVMPAGGTSLILKIACYSGLSVDYTIGQVQVYDLTALGLD